MDRNYRNNRSNFEQDDYRRNSQDDYRRSNNESSYESQHPRRDRDEARGFRSPASMQDDAYESSRRLESSRRDRSFADDNFDFDRSSSFSNYRNESSRFSNPSRYENSRYTSGQPDDPQRYDSHRYDTQRNERSMVPDAFEEARHHSANRRYESSSNRYNSSPSSYSSQSSYEESYTGRGPKGYKRSDERIREEICDTLERHPRIDASEIEVEVKDGEVTLKGSVNQREMKHLAERAVEHMAGVKDVTNQIKTQRTQNSSSFGQHANSQSWNADRSESNDTDLSKTRLSDKSKTDKSELSKNTRLS